MRKMTLPLLGAAAIVLGATSAMAQPNGYFEDTTPPARMGPTPGEQHDMHTGAANTNGSSSVAYDRYGAHADGFPRIRLTNYSGFEGRSWRYNHHHHHRHGQDEPSY